MRAIIRLMTVPLENRDEGWLRDALQAAIQLELGTIPPYLFAFWSIDTSADPDNVASTIFGVAREEMGHMGIACNLLASVGGRPEILAAVSKYPAVLPKDIHQGLEVGLLPLSKDLLLKTFMVIEEPGTMLAEDSDFQSSGSLLIGAFYDSVLDVFASYDKPLATAKQVDLAGFGFPGILRELKDVKDAVGLIKRQGEGNDGSPFEADGELAHFYLFGQIFHGKKLQAVQGSPHPFAYAGTKMQFPAVRPLTLANELESADFNRIYGTMLRNLQQAWDLGGDAGANALIGAISEDMPNLTQAAIALSQLGKGPTFAVADAPAAVVPQQPSKSFVQVGQMLDKAVAGGIFGAHGPFWRGKTRDEFVQLKVFGTPLLVVGNAKESNLVLALRGQGPFGSDTGAAGATFRRMPAGRPALPDADLDFIAGWIDDGCPDTAPAADVSSVSHSTGAQRPDPQVHNGFWRDFDDWAMYYASEQTRNAIGVVFNLFPAWQDFAKDPARQPAWDAALAGDGIRAALEMLAARLKQTVESHYGVPVPLLAVLDGFERFGNDGLPDDPLRAYAPRHNMSDAVLWFVWSAFAGACVQLGIAAEFWRFYTRALLCGLLNDGVYRKRFHVRGFSPVDEDHMKIFEFCQHVPDADLPAELRTRFADSMNKEQLPMIKTIKIYPPIGVARLGNSRDGYFIGPERPDEVVTPAGGFRDGTGLKRQAARFRLFAFDQDGKLVKEITTDDAEIHWTVHIANTKAAAERFHPKSNQNPGLRNAGFHDRNQLKLDPGPVTISGANAGFADLAASRTAGKAKDIEVNQQFLDKPVRFVLGTVTTDDRGRLVALGGQGESKSPTGTPLESPGSDFADHDGWYDDVSDGRVSATVKLADGSQPPVASAWLIVGPPKYAPGLQSIVTLYDTLLQSAVDRGLMANPVDAPNFKPSMARDIQPILTRAANMRWVYNNGAAQFSAPTGFHHTLPQPSPAIVFAKLSKPSATPGNPGTGGSMPKMWSDLYPAGPNGTLTRIQYKMMEMWKSNNVDSTPVTPDASITPEGLTRAALDTCVGAAFFPGIEASWKIRDVFAYVEPFRLDANQISPGDIGAQMSLPWQSDFLDCAVESGNSGTNLTWWPAQRPIAVLKAGGNTYIRWARMANDPASPEMSMEDMITEWHKLGFVTQQAGGRFEEETRP